MSQEKPTYTTGDAEQAIQYLHRSVPKDQRTSLQVHEDTAEALELLKGRLNVGVREKVATVDDVIRLALLVLSRYPNNYDEHDVTERNILRNLQEYTLGIAETTNLHGELIGMSDNHLREVRDPTPFIPDEVARSDVEELIDEYFDNPEKFKEWPGFRRRREERGLA